MNEQEGADPSLEKVHVNHGAEVIKVSLNAIFSNEEVLQIVL